MADLEFIGAEIYFGGYLVAVLAVEGVPASILEDAKDAICDVTSVDVNMEVADKIKKAAESLNRGGLVRWDRLSVAIEKVKDEYV